MWALFTDGHRISRPFRTEEEAWHQARKSGLADGDMLEHGYEIKQFREQAKRSTSVYHDDAYVFRP